MTPPLTVISNQKINRNINLLRFIKTRTYILHVKMTTQFYTIRTLLALLLVDNM